MRLPARVIDPAVFSERPPEAPSQSGLFPAPVPDARPSIASEPDGIRDDLRRLRASLADTAAAHITNASELQRRIERTRRDSLLPTTLAPFDALLGGGLPRGKMVELTGRRGAGRFSIALCAIASATSMGEAAALIDLGDHLDPRRAEEDGVDLRRMLWVRPSTLRQTVMSAEMILAAGFQLVVLDAGLHPIRGRRVPDAAWVRLGRAAEAHGAVLLVSTPYPLSGTASEAVIRTSRTRIEWMGRGLSPRLLSGLAVDLQLEKHRHRKAGANATLLFTMQPGKSTGAGRPTGDGRQATGAGKADEEIDDASGTAPAARRPSPVGLSAPVARRRSPVGF